MMTDMHNGFALLAASSKAWSSGGVPFMRQSKSGKRYQWR